MKSVYFFLDDVNFYIFNVDVAYVPCNLPSFSAGTLKVPCGNKGLCIYDIFLFYIKTEI